MRLVNYFQTIWYQYPSNSVKLHYKIGYWLLFPISLLFSLIIRLRYIAYKIGILPSYAVAAPVIVVGNITVGGTGKSPLVAYLVEQLSLLGLKPGIISRGYAGKLSNQILSVSIDSDPNIVGDEPVMLAKRLQCPIVVGKNRVKAAQHLLAVSDVDIIISDDGLQHYRLKRDIEIAVVDGARKLGNGAWLPAGPLRESSKRLRTVNCIVINNNDKDITNELELYGKLNNVYSMQLKIGELFNSGNKLIDKKNIIEFNKQTVHAVAGIGNPDKFFSHLRQHGIHVIEHKFPDHHSYKIDDFKFQNNQNNQNNNSEFSIFVTEKDYIKCVKFNIPNMWVVPVIPILPNSFKDEICRLLSYSFAMKNSINTRSNSNYAIRS